MTEIHCTIVGLPGSGKTTFLAALWHLIDSGEVSSKLILDRLVGDVEHLNTIVEAWRRCEEVARTSMAAERMVDIHVRDVETNRKCVLSFPDLSGESFEHQLRSRTCKSSYVEMTNRDGGLLVFLTADRPSDGIAIQDLPVDDSDVGETQPYQIREWSAEMLPQQVCIVELLQFLQRHPFERRRRKLALVVSAWDVVDSRDITPANWLARELPLLDQFLKTNYDTFEWRIYGVSAQGGDVKSEQRSDLLRRIPSKRLKCVTERGESHDISEPISWLVSELT